MSESSLEEIGEVMRSQSFMPMALEDVEKDWVIKTLAYTKGNKTQAFMKKSRKSKINKARSFEIYFKSEDF